MPLYTFPCFKVPEATCNKLDAITRAFWWDHDQGFRKLHLVNWDKICMSKDEGGLGQKKFSLINQTMLAKQFWRIHHNPHSLLAKTFKAKYFPRCTIHECTPKPHQSWFWRNIIKHDNIKLKEGKWWVGKGLDIPLNHPGWYLAQNLHNSLLPTSTVADLIDHNSCSWKPDLVRALYPYPWWSDILSIPISKTGSVPDKLVWKFSSNGDFKVHNAYKLLSKDFAHNAQACPRPNSTPSEVWNLLWKVKVPPKIGNFVWKLMHDSLPTFLALKN